MYIRVTIVLASHPKSFETAENSCYCRSLLIQNVSILLVIIESLKVKVSFFLEKENAHGAYFFSDVAIETLLVLSFFWNRPKSVRSHQNLHFYKRNRHFFKTEKYLQPWISSKPAGDGGVTTVILRRPPREGGVRGV